MESGGGIPPAGALGAAAESPQCPLPSGGEGAAGLAGQGEPDASAESAGGEGGPRRALRAVYVCSESPQGGAAGGPEVGARQCLLRACEAEGAHLTSVPFGELDFGETAVLDAFYDAGEAGALFTSTPLLPAPVPPHPSTLCLFRQRHCLAFGGGDSGQHYTLLQIVKQRPQSFTPVYYAPVSFNIR